MIKRTFPQLKENILIFYKNNKENILSFGIILFVSFIFSYQYLSMHFSNDSFITETDPYGAAMQTMNLGRLFWSFAFMILDILRVNLIRSQFFFTLFSIIILAISTFLLYKIFLKVNKIINSSLITKIILGIASILVVFNVFSTELFSFPELTPFSSLALLLIIIALWKLQYIKGFRTYILVYALLCMSLFFYQTWISLFFPLAVLITIPLKKINLKTIILKLFGLISIYGLAIITNFLSIKIVNIIWQNPNPRFNNVDIVDNIITIVKLQGHIWLGGLSVIPNNIFFLSLVIGILLFIFLLSFSQNKLFKSFVFFTTIISLIILSFLPMLITTIWIVTRTVVGLGGIIGIILISLIIFLERIDTNKKIIKIYLILCLLCGGVLLGFNAIQYNKIASNQLLSNQLDKELILKYYNSILKYETETKKDIKSISFIQDVNPTPCHKNTPCFGDSNVNILFVEWGKVQAFNYYTNRNFVGINNGNETNLYITHFLSKDFTEFSPDLVYIDNETAYLILY